jgi:uncharacterized membrane protein YeiB
MPPSSEGARPQPVQPGQRIALSHISRGFALTGHFVEYFFFEHRFWWTGRFRRGTTEWLGRSLTYGTVQPTRLPSEAGTR